MSYFSFSYLKISLVSVILLFNIQFAFCKSDQIVVGEYKEWNGISSVSIKKVFNIKDYREVVVSVNNNNVKAPREQAIVYKKLEDAITRFPDNIFKKIKSENNEINFTREETINLTSNSIDDTSQREKPEPIKRLIVKIRLLRLEGYYSSALMSGFSGQLIPYQALKLLTQLDGEIIDAESSELLATFDHARDSMPKDSLFSRDWVVDGINKIIDDAGEDIGNLLSEFSH